MRRSAWVGGWLGVLAIYDRHVRRHATESVSGFVSQNNHVMWASEFSFGRVTF